MILHLITDRHRLAPSATLDEALACLVAQARAAVAARLDVIQVRERDLEAGPLSRVVAALVQVTRGTPTRLVVNDRLDVALACGADGVHLRGDSFDAADVRRMAPARFLVGRSVRAASDLARVGPVDYVVAGTIWSTPSKAAGHRLLGLDGLSAVCAVSHVPVVAIGGVEPDCAGFLAMAGAAGAAAIGAFIGDEPAACRAVPLVERADALRRAFDSPDPRS